MKNNGFMSEYNTIKQNFLKKVFNELKKFKDIDELNKYFVGCGNRNTTPWIEELFNLCLSEKIIINSFYLIKLIPLESNLRIYPEQFNFTHYGEIDISNEIEVFPRLIFEKGILYTILEKLGLDKTKEWLIMYNIIFEKELNEKIYYNENDLENFNLNDYQLLLKEELEKKYKKKDILIKL